eukprot:TRINITY_DN20136_c0_g1_i1.p1 TRINITY_DN20136_c0_g1~~TRINITY_DN20136_c0_g1_i1.p1  ORF type:complete len:224 (+),score=58.03 TRINITY_DN20136_c0_g1_i1:119-790(+)
MTVEMECYVKVDEALSAEEEMHSELGGGIRQTMQMVQDLARCPAAGRESGVAACRARFTAHQQLFKELEVRGSGTLPNRKRDGQVEGHRRALRELSSALNAAGDALGREERRELMEDRSKEVCFKTHKGRLAKGNTELREALVQLRDTEEVSIGIMQELDRNRESILTIDSHTDRASASLSRSSSLIRQMRFQDVRCRVLVAFLGTLLTAGATVLVLLATGIL